MLSMKTALFALLMVSVAVAVNVNSVFFVNQQMYVYPLGSAYTLNDVYECEEVCNVTYDLAQTPGAFVFTLAEPVNPDASFSGGTPEEIAIFVEDNFPGRKAHVIYDVFFTSGADHSVYTEDVIVSATAESLQGMFEITITEEGIQKQQVDEPPERPVTLDMKLILTVIILIVAVLGILKYKKQRRRV